MADTTRALVERLFAEHGHGLRAFLRRRLAAAPDAAELAQEVYARLLRAPDAGTIRNTEAYLFTVAGNLVKEHRVLEQRRREALDVDNAALQAELAVGPSSADEIDAARRERRLREVLNELAPQCRAVLVLQYWQGLSHEAIAHELGISRRMVKRHLGLALAHCRRRMQRMR